MSFWQMFWITLSSPKVRFHLGWDVPNPHYLNGLLVPFQSTLSFPDSSAGKESACNVGDLGLIPGLGRSPEEYLATHCTILPGESPWTEELGGLQFMWLQRVGHDWVTTHSTARHLIVTILYDSGNMYLSKCFIIRLNHSMSGLGLFLKKVKFWMTVCW